jgi:hypothetical protein
MSNPAWPAYPFPQDPLINPFAERTTPNVVVSEMEDGPDHIRQRSTYVKRFFEVTMILDADQKAAFQSFYESDCAGGAQPFDWKHPVTDAPTTFRFRSVDDYVPYAKDIWKVKFLMEVYLG